MKAISIILNKRFLLYSPIIIIAALGLALSLRRFIYGLGSVTALSDAFPWGLWVGFDVVTGVAMAAGGFIVTGIVYVFNAQRFKPVLRPAILTAFLGYLLVCAGLFYDLGKPYNIWHPLVMWNPHSVMFEVAWCVTLYTTVLGLEFGSIVAEALKWNKLVMVFRAVAVPLVMAGVLLSTLHQSSLGSLFLIVPLKLHHFWYSSLLPLHFFLSAVSVGFAMVILESFLTSFLMKRGLEFDLLADLGRFLWFALVVFLAVRVQDLTVRDALGGALAFDLESRAFLLEMLLFFSAVVLLSIRRVHASRLGLFLAALFTAVGVIVNRLNVSVIGLLSDSGSNYFPAWSEIAITVFLGTMGVVAFFAAARYLSIFPEEKKAEA